MIKKIRQESTIPEKPFPKNKDKYKNDPLWLPDGEEDKYHLDSDAAEWTSPDEDYDTGDLERIVGHRTRVVEGKIQHQLQAKFAGKGNENPIWQNASVLCHWPGKEAKEKLQRYLQAHVGAGLPSHLAQLNKTLLTLKKIHAWELSGDDQTDENFMDNLILTVTFQEHPKPRQQHDIPAARLLEMVFRESMRKVLAFICKMSNRYPEFKGKAPTAKARTRSSHPMLDPASFSEGNIEGPLGGHIFNGVWNEDMMKNILWEGQKEQGYNDCFIWAFRCLLGCPVIRFRQVMVALVAGL